MTFRRLRSAFLALCAFELVITVERQVFDFLGYMWTPILANFLNVLFLIFGGFGAVQKVPKYLLAYVCWSVVWLAWNGFLVCLFLNIGSLNRESDVLSLGTGSVSWWEGSGWGCRPVWGEGGAGEAGGAWLRPTRVDGCLLPWPRVELAQALLSLAFTAAAFTPAVLLTMRDHNPLKPKGEKEKTTRRPIYTIELSPTAAAVSESAPKPMTPRRVKRRSGSRGASVRRSRRSYRNAGFLASTASLPREARPPSAHSSYSNFHGARPASYHAPDRVESASFEIAPRESYDATYDSMKRSYGNEGAGRTFEVAPSYESTPRLDVAGAEASYGSHYVASYMSDDAPPPPAPPYCARATPQAPGPPAYRASPDAYLQ